MQSLPARGCAIGVAGEARLDALDLVILAVHAEGLQGAQEPAEDEVLADWGGGEGGNSRQGGGGRTDPTRRTSGSRRARGSLGEGRGTGAGGEGSGEMGRVERYAQNTPWGFHAKGICLARGGDRDQLPLVVGGYVTSTENSIIHGVSCEGERRRKGMDCGAYNLQPRSSGMLGGQGEGRGGDTFSAIHYRSLRIGTPRDIASESTKKMGVQTERTKT